MATLEELKTQWANDCVISDELGEEAIRTPKLHAKYLDELINAKLKHTKLVHEFAELKALKARYFRGELTKQELESRGWEQWQYKTLKADIADLIEADSELQKINARESYIRTIIYFLESVLGEIKNRNWSIKAAIDWQRFRAGL